MYALINGRLIVGNQIIDNKALIIKGEYIQDIIDVNKTPRDSKIIDVKGCFISAGFIDLQVNGCGGALFNDDISEQTIHTMYNTNVKGGCTSFLPTLITASQQDIKKALQIATSFYQNNPNKILGIHIEGPFISKEKKGIHNEDYIQQLTKEKVDIFIEAVKDIPIILTLAPEENDKVFIQQLVQAGVKVSVGHSNASYKEACDAFDMGVGLVTHLYNAMSYFSSREPNVVGATLNTENVKAGIIVDGFHSNFASVRMAKKLKKENLFIVTDAATPVGTNMKSFEFGGQKLFVKEGRLVNKEGVLGGANITMIESVKNASEQANFGLVEAVRSASLYPARVMNVENKLGLIQAGFIANLVIFDSNYKMQFAVTNGNLIKV